MRRTLLLTACAAVAMAPATAQAAEEAGGGGSWLLFTFFAINFILFVVVLVYYAAPLARQYFGDRAQGIRAGLDRARNAFDDAERMAKDAAAAIARLEDDVRRLRDEMEAETRTHVAQIAEAARAGAQRLRRDTELTAAALADNARRRLRAHLAEIATNVARDMIGQHFRADDQGRLVADFMERIGQEARQ